MSFEENIIEAVWEKASPIEGYDRERFRKDCCGAIIAKDKYGDIDSVFVWQIDHVYPKKIGGKDDLDNLVPCSGRIMNQKVMTIQRIILLLQRMVLQI